MKVATLKYNGTGEVEVNVTAYYLKTIATEKIVTAIAISYQTIVPFEIGETPYYVQATHYPSPRWDDQYVPLEPNSLWECDQGFPGTFRDVRIGKIDNVANYSGLNDHKILDWLRKEEKIFLTNEVIANVLFKSWMEDQEKLEIIHKEESEKIQKLVDDLNKKMTQHRINRLNIQKIQNS